MVHPLPAKLPLVRSVPCAAAAARLASRVLRVRAGVERAAARGRVRVEAGPLLAELPIVGALHVSRGRREGFGG